VFITDETVLRNLVVHEREQLADGADVAGPGGGEDAGQVGHGR
jgi:hypothetical protein